LHDHHDGGCYGARVGNPRIAKGLETIHAGGQEQDLGILEVVAGHKHLIRLHAVGPRHQNSTHVRIENQVLDPFQSVPVIRSLIIGHGTEAVLLQILADAIAAQNEQLLLELPVGKVTRNGTCRIENFLLFNIEAQALGLLEQFRVS